MLGLSIRRLKPRTLHAGHHVPKRLLRLSNFQTCLPKPTIQPRIAIVPSSHSGTIFMSTQSPSRPIEVLEHTVEILGNDGQMVTRRISPSYPDKPKAVANLLKYLSSIQLFDGPRGTAFRSRGWELNASGDLISRFAAFNSEQELKQAHGEINTAASELNHHPTIFSNTAKTQSISYMLIACTTHSPPGLSVKDAKLAKRVDEILENMGERDDSKDNVLNAAELLAQRQEAWIYIETKVAEDCACACKHGAQAG